MVTDGACGAIMAKRGSLTVADSNALDTFLTFVVGEANREALCCMWSRRRLAVSWSVAASNARRRPNEGRRWLW